MADHRIAKLAQVLVNYSLDLKPGESLLLNTTPLTQELSLAVYKEATLAGTHILALNRIPGAQELFFKHAGDEQLEYISPVFRQVVESFEAHLQLGADHNTRELSGIRGLSDDYFCASRSNQDWGIFKSG